MQGLWSVKKEMMAKRRELPWIYVLPLFSLAVIGLSFFLAPPEETVVSALVLGGPTDTGEQFSGRAQVTGLSQGVEVPKEGYLVEVEGIFSGRRVTRRYTTGSAGWFEFHLPKNGQELLGLRLRDARGRLLAAGRPTLSHVRWNQAAERRGGELPLHQQGSVSVRLAVGRSVLAVPFEERVTAQVSFTGGPAELSVRGEGLELTGPPQAEDGGKEYRFLVKPTSHSASLHVSLKADGETLTFEQALPVIPGALWFERAGGKIRIVSPIPRDEAWFTYVTERERLLGGRVPLVTGEDGTSSGTFDVPVAAEQAEFLVLSPSPEGRSSGTVGYPLRGQRETFDAVDGYLLDGGPSAKTAFVRRAERARSWMIGYAAVSFLLTLFLFVMGVRRTQAKLERDLERVGAEPGAYDRSALPLTVAAVCLFFAFSAAVLWIVVR